MKKTKATVHTARLLVFALLIGLLIPFGALDAQALNVVGLCAKCKNAAVYTDNLSIKSNSTQKISFDKKDYKDVWGWSAKKDKEWPVSVTKIK